MSLEKSIQEQREQIKNLQEKLQLLGKTNVSMSSEEGKVHPPPATQMPQQHQQTEPQLQQSQHSNIQEASQQQTTSTLHDAVEINLNDFQEELNQTADAFALSVPMTQSRSTPNRYDTNTPAHNMKSASQSPEAPAEEKPVPTSRLQQNRDHYQSNFLSPPKPSDSPVHSSQKHKRSGFEFPRLTESPVRNPRFNFEVYISHTFLLFASH